MNRFMKKNLFLAGALFMGMTIVAGCSTEESLEQILGNETIVEATIENGGSRTSVNSLYQVVWTAEDAFTVWGADGSSKGNMTLQDEGGTTKGKFAGDVTLAEGDVALFPSVEGSDKAYTFPSAYTSTETDAPMLGTYNGVSFSFKQLAAMLRIGASGLTAGTEYTLTITSTGEQALVGNATLGDNDALIPAGEGKVITVTLTPADGVTSLTFDAPIPAQTYNGLKVELKAGNADATVLKEVQNFEAKAGVLYEATTQVTTAEGLVAALAKGGTIDLGAAVTLANPLTVEENTTLELNGHTLDAGANSISVAEGKTLTIQNASSLSRSASAPAITATGIVIRAGKNSVINIGEGVNISSTGGCCVFVPGGVDGVTVNIAGNLTSKGNFAAVQTSGNTGTSAVVNITGGNVTSECEGVYFPSQVSLNISGGTITGTTAVYQKSGNLNISGGTLIATGERKEYTYNGNGCNATGDALVIEACEYPNGVPAVSITGGTFISENAKAIGYYQQSSEYKLGNEKFVTGGTFSDPSACCYLGANANVKVNMEKDYAGKGLVVQNGQTLVLSIAEGKKYDVTELVGSAGTETLGAQFLQGSNVTIEGKGTFTSSVAKMLVNNYGNLTLKGCTLAPTAVPAGMTSTYYVLSNNCGEVNIEEGTIITAPTGNDSQEVYAFDVCKYASYPNVTVNIKGGTINGNVEYTGTDGDKQKLNISGGTIIGNLVIADGYKEAAETGISIIGGVQNGSGWPVYADTE